MCVLAVGWRVFASAPLVIWSNRDEFCERPTAPLARWTTPSSIIGGRDLREGGTWLAVHEGGRFAAITNFRDPSERRANARSRGEIPVAFLMGDAPVDAFLGQLRSQRAQYRGFNLLIGDTEQAALFESRRDRMTYLSNGVYTLSNGDTDSAWPKQQRLERAMRLAAASDEPTHGFDALADDTVAPEVDLPRTGVSPEIELALSSVFIPPSAAFSAAYQTRASTIVNRSASRWRVTERSFTGLAFSETTVCV